GRRLRHRVDDNLASSENRSAHPRLSSPKAARLSWVEAGAQNNPDETILDHGGRRRPAVRPCNHDCGARPGTSRILRGPAIQIAPTDTQQKNTTTEKPKPQT